MLTVTLLLAPAMIAVPQSSPLEARVEATLAQMSTEEKIDMIGGVEGFYIRDLPRLGLPKIKMSDGPVGVRNYGPTTAYPAILALTASFDPTLAEKFGRSIGRDARARGVHVWLAPGVNLARIPQNGRNFEYSGEDPWLAGRTAVGIIKGVQSAGVVATVKHFAGNEHENDRNRDSSDIDERTLRELYLRPFEMAVKEGGVWAVMSSYNKYKNIYCSEQPFLVEQILKKEWGFKGVYMSDWGAAHSTLGTVNHGLDLEMPGGDYMNRRTILPLIASGKVAVATIDDKVRRILRMTYAMGFADRPQEDKSIPAADPASEAVSVEIARAGVVLLKNKNNLLPFARSHAKRIVVVGPNGHPAVTGGGGSAYTTPSSSLSLVDALRKVAGPGVSVEYFPGVVRMSDPMARANFWLPGQREMKGFRGEYFANPRLEGTPALVRNDEAIDFNWDQRAPGEGIQRNDFSARWTTDYRPTETGGYLLLARSDDGVRIKVDGKLVHNEWHDRGAVTDQVAMTFKAGQTYRIEIEYYQGRGDATMSFGIVPQDALMEKLMPKSVLAGADLVVVATGLNPGMESEGSDRPFALPDEQRILAEYATSLNPKTVIVNNSGGPVGVSPFIDRAGAMLQAWYPGGLGNLAVAEILFGDTNPSGKLPLSWPRTLQGTYYAKAYPPIDHRIVYTEGLYMGYRWFDHNRAAPLFPFGYGLSYSTFAIGKPTVKADAHGFTASVVVKNLSKRPGAETVQLYAGYPSSRVPRAVRELKAFRRVNLPAGGSQVVHFSVSRGQMAYYDVAKHGWVVEPGKVEVAIGTSSRNLSAKSLVSIR